VQGRHLRQTIGLKAQTPSPKRTGRQRDVMTSRLCVGMTGRHHSLVTGRHRRLQADQDRHHSVTGHHCIPMRGQPCEVTKALLQGQRQSSLAGQGRAGMSCLQVLASKMLGRHHLASKMTDQRRSLLPGHRSNEMSCHHRLASKMRGRQRGGTRSRALAAM